MIGNKLNKEAVDVTCPKCKHKFMSRSKLMMRSCNSCGHKFKIEVKEAKA